MRLELVERLFELMRRLDEEQNPEERDSLWDQVDELKAALTPEELAEYRRRRQEYLEERRKELAQDPAWQAKLERFTRFGFISIPDLPEG